ncbi:MULTISPECIES: hypothetical protein [Brevibacterium]|uniref:hypothetical protein n=1 Tax=Brevibacterium TaxID=1696 RepID=UPI000A289173|nr:MULTISPECIES: hypothetical protein [Brevibacterium]
MHDCEQQGARLQEPDALMVLRFGDHGLDPGAQLHLTPVAEITSLWMESDPGSRPGPMQE